LLTSYVINVFLGLLLHSLHLHRWHLFGHTVLSMVCCLPQSVLTAIVVNKRLHAILDESFLLIVH